MNAYQVDSNSQFTARLRSVRNTEASRAGLWRDLITEGVIMTFRTAGGHIITAGRYQQAVGYHPGAALLGLPNGKEYHDNAWGIGLRIVEHCGRSKPISVSLGL